jgi:hypothetical protein
MRRLIFLAAGALGALGVFASQAGAHPITPRGLGGATATFAGGDAPGHVKGLACAEEVSPAIGAFDVACTVAPFGQP